MLDIKNEDYKTKENNLLQSICASPDPVLKDEKKNINNIYFFY